MPVPISRRQSLHLEGVSHGSTPIPMGSRIANVIYTSGISGIDRATSTLAPDAAAQVRHAFLNLQDLLAGAGSCLEDVIRLTVYLKSETSRQHVNENWLACFPDPGSRPARHILMYELKHGMEIQIEAICVIQKN